MSGIRFLLPSIVVIGVSIDAITRSSGSAVAWLLPSLVLLAALDAILATWRARQLRITRAEWWLPALALVMVAFAVASMSGGFLSDQNQGTKSSGKISFLLFDCVLAGVVLFRMIRDARIGIRQQQ